MNWFHKFWQIFVKFFCNTCEGYDNYELGCVQLVGCAQTKVQHSMFVRTALQIFPTTFITKKILGKLLTI